MLNLVACRVVPYMAVEGLQDVGLSKSILIQVAKADGFQSLGLHRREVLWQVVALDDRPVGLFEGQPSESSFETGIVLPVMSESEQVVHDYGATTFSLRGHPVQYLRDNLTALGCVTAGTLRTKNNGDFIRLAGVPFVRYGQRRLLYNTGG